MKNTLLSLVFLLTIVNCSTDGMQGLSNETELNYINKILATGTTSSTGLVAPPGMQFSEIKPSLNYGMNCFYLNFQENARFTISDDFIIPQNEIWNINTISFFVINPDPVSTNFPVKNIAIEIYDGNPDLASSKKLYGDLDTNLFKSATPTNTYRITNETTNVLDAANSSLIYQVETALPGSLNLKGGHYWYKMTSKFNYGEDWSCYIPRLPAAGNDTTTFNAYFKNLKTGDLFKTDNGLYDGSTTPINYETPFQIKGTKTVF